MKHFSNIVLTISMGTFDFKDNYLKTNVVNSFGMFLDLMVVHLEVIKEIYMVETIEVYHLKICKWKFLNWFNFNVLLVHDFSQISWCMKMTYCSNTRFEFLKTISFNLGLKLKLIKAIMDLKIKVKLGKLLWICPQLRLRLRRILENLWATIKAIKNCWCLWSY